MPKMKHLTLFGAWIGYGLSTQRQSSNGQAHYNRGDGVGKEVTASTPIDVEWNSMFKNEDTNKELYTVTSRRLTEEDYRCVPRHHIS